MAFLVVLFLIKTGFVFKNPFSSSKQENGLTYSNATIRDLVNKDTDGDGIPDWEESLWGTDPTKKETTPGISDSVAIEKLKIQQEISGQINGTNQKPENITQTDQFSRDLFATVVMLNQNGEVDQATVDKLGSSLAENIQNSAPQKIFSLIDLKISTDNSFQAIKKYSDTLDNIYQKISTKYTVIDVLQKFAPDENDVDVSALSGLNPIIKQISNSIDGMKKTEVPQSLALLHLDLINGLQRLEENLNDIKLYDTDIIVALGGISKYGQNAIALESIVDNLANAISKKLNN